MEKQLPKITAKNVTYEDWHYSRAPFDAANCGICITMHYGGIYCSDPKHQPLTAALKKIKNFKSADYATDAWLRKHFKTLAALRKKYARFWKK